jgi:SAM-dependent methyltransferase
MNYEQKVAEVLLEPEERDYSNVRRKHWDSVACGMDSSSGWSSFYHMKMAQLYAFVVEPGVRILELGCSQGDLLAALKPSYGVGVDFSGEMISRARSKHPQLTFIQADVHDFETDENFDVIVMSDIVNDLEDVQHVLEQVKKYCRPRTKVILSFFSHLWEKPLKFTQRCGLSSPTLAQNWMTVGDVSNLLYLADFEVVKCSQEILLPLRFPLLSTLSNSYLVKMWPFRYFALTNIMIARPKPPEKEPSDEPTVSVVVPARNEAGNIENIFRRIPGMGGGTELILVEGHSIDGTYEAIEKAMAANPERRCKLLKQPGKGKADAVRLGFEHASGDILMILDADLTVSPEDLPKFYQALHSGKAEFVNGVRLVYPMEAQSMRFLNLLGNRFFSVAFSWLLGQPIKDSLCGTKVLWKKDYDRITRNRNYFGDFDPFGDFDLLFGAAKLGLKIVDLPIRYRERTYGTTQIQRWRHGWLLLRMVLFAARRIKFV